MPDPPGAFQRRSREIGMDDDVTMPTRVERLVEALVKVPVRTRSGPGAA